MITAIERDLILASLIAAGEAWDPAGLFLGVYVSGYAPTLTLTLADLVLPPGSLATAIAVATWATRTSNPTAAPW
ncbi:MAG: hypothetical protein HC834_07035 [Rhodospirillales bacterium]|nr:hypothetical protein [Rhodospirillales bacterium]